MSNASIWNPNGEIPSTANADNSYLTQVFTATAGQTVFTLTEFAYQVGTGSLLVLINGVDQVISLDFSETSNTSFTLTSGAEVGDQVVARGLIGSTGASSAAESAATASTAAAASIAAYNAIVGLGLPSLPLALNLGGTGAAYGSLAALFKDMNPTSTKGDLIVTDGTSMARLPVGANGLQLTADSTQTYGMRWGATIYNVKVYAATDTLDLSALVNKGYLNQNAAITLNATTASVGTIYSYSAPTGTLTVTSTGGVQVNFTQNVDYLLTDKTLTQGLWTTTGTAVTYGRKQTLSGTKYLGSYQADASTVIVCTVDVNNIYLTVYNPTTGVLGPPTTIVNTGGSTYYSSGDLSSDLLIANFFANGTGYFVFCLANASAKPLSVFACSVSGSTIVAGTPWTSGTVSAAAAGGLASILVQMSATQYIAIVSNNTQHDHTPLTVTASSTATPTAGTTASQSTWPGAVRGSILNAFSESSTNYIVAYQDTGTTANGAYANTVNFGTGIITIGTATSYLTGLASSASSQGMLYKIAGQGYVLLGQSSGGSTQYRLLTVSGTVITAPKVQATLTGVHGWYGIFAAGGAAAGEYVQNYFRSDVYKIRQNFGWIQGSNLMLTSGKTGTLGASLLPVNFSAGAFSAGTTVTIGSPLTTTATACVVYKTVAGNYYYSDNNLNAIKAYSIGTGTVTAGTTLVGSYNNTFDFFNENYMLGNYYTVNAGVATLVGPYTFADNTIRAAISSAIFIGSTPSIVDKVV